MGLFRRRPETRRPHPDAAVEAELQRIISVRLLIAGKEAQLEHDRALIREVDQASRNSGDLDLGMIERDRLSETLRKEVRQLEQDIPELHDDIAKRIATLQPDDLLWL